MRKAWLAAAVCALGQMYGAQALAQELCVSRMSFVETQNLLVFQTTRDNVPPMAPVEGMWATVFAQLLGADFPIQVETAMDAGGMWWSVDGMVFQQRPSELPTSMEQALVNAMKPETGGSLRLELDGTGCLKATLTGDTLKLTTPSKHTLMVTVGQLKATKDATKNPKARVFSYTGGAVLKLIQGSTAAQPLGSDAKPAIEIIRY